MDEEGWPQILDFYHCFLEKKTDQSKVANMWVLTVYVRKRTRSGPFVIDLRSV
jgi:hypothetical protein